MCDHSLYSRYILYLQYSCICMTDYDPLAKRCARVRVCMLLAMELVEGIQKSPRWHEAITKVHTGRTWWVTCTKYSRC